jgi:hypothetical protein
LGAFIRRCGFWCRCAFLRCCGLLRCWGLRRYGGLPVHGSGLRRFGLNGGSGIAQCRRRAETGGLVVVAVRFPVGHPLIPGSRHPAGRYLVGGVSFVAGGVVLARLSVDSQVQALIGASRRA